MGELHHHACPRCHELPACLADCTVEPDLGTTPGGYPKAHPVVCVRCEREALTPSEVALSKVLAALAAWGPVCGGKLSDADRALVDASKGIAAHGFWLDGDVTEAGTALLDRARKAGVL